MRRVGERPTRARALRERAPHGIHRGMIDRHQPALLPERRTPPRPAELIENQFTTDKTSWAKLQQEEKAYLLPFVKEGSRLPVPTASYPLVVVTSLLSRIDGGLCNILTRFAGRRSPSLLRQTFSRYSPCNDSSNPKGLAPLPWLSGLSSARTVPSQMPSPRSNSASGYPRPLLHASSVMSLPSFGDSSSCSAIRHVSSLPHRGLVCQHIRVGRGHGRPPASRMRVRRPSCAACSPAAGSSSAPTTRARIDACTSLATHEPTRTTQPRYHRDVSKPRKRSAKKPPPERKVRDEDAELESALRDVNQAVESLWLRWDGARKAYEDAEAGTRAAARYAPAPRREGRSRSSGAAPRCRHRRRLDREDPGGPRRGRGMRRDPASIQAVRARTGVPTSRSRGEEGTTAHAQPRRSEKIAGRSRGDGRARQGGCDLRHRRSEAPRQAASPGPRARHRPASARR